MLIYKIIKKISTFLYYTFIVFLVIITSTIIISALEVPKGWRIFTVSSGSMSPNISSGSLIITKKENDYLVGDAVTFEIDKNKRDYTTHRIFKIDDKDNIIKFITKGDANDALDNNLITSEQIIGKVVFQVPFLGTIITTAKTNFGKVFLIIIPVIIIIYVEIKKIINEMKNIKTNGKLIQNNLEMIDKKE